MKFNNETIRTAVQEWVLDAKQAEIKYGHISNWNTSRVTNMASLFSTYDSEGMAFHEYDNIINFNDDIGDWDVSNVTNMSCMFSSAHSFNQYIGDWDVSNVTDMRAMFILGVFNKNIGNWNVSRVTNMRAMFDRTKSFNQDIGNWDVSNVSNMDNMFCGDHLDNIRMPFNQDVGKWDVSSVTNMNSMFSYSLFNQDIGNWDVSNVTNMDRMFATTRLFNQDIGNWDVSEVTNMECMFISANAFNQDLSKWDVSNVSNMSGMFCKTKSFNQNLKNWQVNKDVDVSDIFTKAKSFKHDISNWDWLNVNESNLTGDIYIAMEKSTFFFGDDEEFDALELRIEFGNEGDGEHEIIDEIKEKLNCEHLIFTETENKDGEFELQRIIDLPEIDDHDGYGDGGHHGPFSSDEEVISFVKNLKTISYKKLNPL